MLKVVIADDEAGVCQLILMLADWGGLGRTGADWEWRWPGWPPTDWRHWSWWSGFARIF